MEQLFSGDGQHVRAGRRRMYIGMAVAGQGTRLQREERIKITYISAIKHPGKRGHPQKTPWLPERALGEIL